MSLEELKKQLEDGKITQEQFDQMLTILGLTVEEETPPDDPNGNSPEDVQKMINDAVQKQLGAANKEHQKQKKALEDELERLKTEKMTEEERQKHELEKQLKDFETQKLELQQEKNKMHAIKSVKKLGLDDGSDNVLDLIDVVVAGASSEEEIDARVSKFNALVQTFVKSQVDERFKDGGREPNKGKGGSGTKNPYSKEHWNLTKQMELEQSNPELAKSLELSANN